MENKFIKGDRVFDIMYGWGNVINIDTYDRNCVEVLFDDNLKKTYLFDALYPSEGGYPRPVLSFTEYRLEGFTQERPEKLPNKGDIVWVRNNQYANWVVQQFICKKDNKYETTSENPFDWQSYSSLFHYMTTKNPFENGTPVDKK